MKRGLLNRWVFENLDWQKINQVYAADHPRSIEQRLPPLFRQHLFGVEVWQWIALAVVTSISWLVAWVLAYLLAWFFGRIAMRTTADWDNQLVAAARAPLRVVIFVFCEWTCNAFIRFLATLEWTAYPILRALAVFGIAWFAVRVVSVTSKTIAKTYGSSDGAKYRGLRTQVAVFERILSALIALIGGAIILTQFEFFRTVGISLLASAGVAGVVFGLAAQRSLSGVISGILISFTQPIRIGDLVIVEGEQGTVEDITLTYVVIHVWDHRRLIVPVSRFLETPFQNWTRSSTDLLGTVLLQVDLSAPIALIREELRRFCTLQSQWDQKTCSVIVLDIHERSCEVRCLVSASNADDLWALRCAVREHMLGWLQGLDCGRYLPKVRVQSESRTL
jgi:small-conductance mechanosensitive channel